MLRKKILAMVGVAAVALTMGGCAADAGGSEDSAGTVGILMPSTTNTRWQIEADAMTETLAERGFDTTVQFANDDAATQVGQLEDMITNGVSALVVVPVDGKSLGGPLADANALDIPVVSYTRLLQDTDGVDYYTTFDYTSYGALSATAILQALGIQDEAGNDTGETGPFNLEVVNGSSTDSVAYEMWDGYNDVLGSYLDSGVLTIPSGQDTFDQSATPNWNSERAQERMENIITSTYSDGRNPDAVWVPYDGLTRGVISALLASGFSPTGDRWPVLTGGDAEVDSVKAILAGEQYSTVFLDYKDLAVGTAEMVADVLEGGDFPSPDKVYDNGSIDVPAKLFALSLVRDDNVEEVLVDSGFYSAEEIGLN
jgi:putative multiple sugar transport system substrate-binding protein